MRINLTWILFLILPCVSVWSRPLEPTGAPTFDAQNMPKLEDSSTPPEQVISVRITSSVAVGRGKGKPNRLNTHDNKHRTSTGGYSSSMITDNMPTEKHSTVIDTTTASPELAGANIEFIKQLHSKKEARGLQHFEGIHSFPSNIETRYSNETDSIAEPSVKSVLEVGSENEDSENIEQIPIGRSLSLSPAPKNFIQGLTHKPSERGNNPRLTTVSFNILHDRSKVTGDYEPTDTYNTQRSAEVPKFYNEPAKVYSQPAQVYSEPAKFYSEPAKVYSEPAKVYSEPAKIYSEPAKIYSEPAKFYSQPASLHLPAADYTQWQPTPPPMSSITTPVSTVTMSTVSPSTQRIEQMPEKNYEVDEKLSVLTDGRSHGVQESTTESCKQENCKVGYVVEGRQYRKYRVEERTADGFIVGEYGVVRHEDGALRGVRYTADGDASPRLIYDALMKFLQLK